MENQKLAVVEIFYSLQGEGARAGHPTIFIRLAGCNMNCSFCDTKWDEGTGMTLEEIRMQIKSLQTDCYWICWTGGEPTLQLSQDVVAYFKELGYHQAIESNGSNPIPKGLDYVSISPKVPLHRLLEVHQNTHINELRYVVGYDSWEDTMGHIPDINLLPKADAYYLSPMFVGKAKEKMQLNQRNLDMAICFIKNDPRWRLSVQQHKLWNIR